MSGNRNYKYKPSIEINQKNLNFKRIEKAKE